MDFKGMLTNAPNYFKFMVDFSTKPIQTVESLTKEGAVSGLSPALVTHLAAGIAISMIVVFIGRAIGMDPDHSNFVLVIDRFVESSGSWGALATLPVAWIVLTFLFAVAAHLSIKITGFIRVLSGSTFYGSFWGTLNAAMAISAWAIPCFTILLVGIRITEAHQTVNLWVFVAVVGIFSIAFLFYTFAAFAGAHRITLAQSSSLIVMTFALYIFILKYTRPLFDDRHYYEVTFKIKSPDWRDTSFVVATSNEKIIAEAEGQLRLPVGNRKMLTGELAPGDDDYNKNASHEFQWHYDEENWGFAELSMELCDGRPYSDVDENIDEWLGNVKRFCPWNSYIRKEIKRPD